MRWILLDVALAVVALAGLVVVGLSLWRRVKALSRQLTAAGETVGRATAEIERLQNDVSGPASRAGRAVQGGVGLAASTKE